ncbi:glutamyl-tRNA reductase [Calderihabitans maritimus]|uniref:Glutamyl-tRNA reductase n=1 Tax=Calderihabitans maritimus TaxID=1246530 RepID=A0A1Z5HW92_9FIRM|nr:glutamyl-tRNA reductase [Calderihabitans maritimus]GAW93601.1 glutamyl-tRNA reductase [Calderihabitans maritimus]
MFILTVGLNHKTAPVEVREKLAFSEESLPEALAELKEQPQIEGCVILSTCNRTELYAATTDVEAGLASLHTFLSRRCNMPLTELREFLYTHTLYDAVRHLFRVASGLDSMVLGETEILGQVRDAYQIACDHSATNGVLNTFFQQAITVGKRVRTETKIDQNPVSISYTAVELVRQQLEDLSGLTALIVGAGEMGELTVKHLVANGISRILVANRSYERAVRLPERFQGEAVEFSQLLERMKEADVVVSCTAATHYIIKRDDIARVMREREGQPMFLIDIAVPRDIEPEVGGIEGVTLYDIDGLKNVVDRNLEQRRKAAEKAEKIIEEEIESFFKWLGSLFVVPTIVALKEKANRIKEAELTRALNRLAPVTEREKKVISSMANSIVNQLLHDPIINLKERATTKQGHLYAEILQNLFNLEVEGQRPKEKKIGQKPVGINTQQRN